MYLTIISKIVFIECFSVFYLRTDFFFFLKCVLHATLIYFPGNPAFCSLLIQLHQLLVVNKKEMPSEVNKILFINFHCQQVVINSIKNKWQNILYRWEESYFLFYLLIMFKIQLTSVHQCLKGDSVNFVRKVHFQCTFCPGYPLVVSLVIIELSYTHQGRTRFFRVSCRVAHLSILNACWQTDLFVEMWLLLYSQDSWSVFMQSPQSHVQL